jgi:AmmeMemoRadiSam system protein B
MTGGGGSLPRIKEPHLAGRWYAGDAAALATTVRDLLAAAGEARPGVCAILVPHAAYQYSGPTAARGWAAAGARRRVVVLAPSHYATFRGAAVLPLEGYRTPLGVVPIDRATVEALARAAVVRANPAVFLREHALEIQLPLLQRSAPHALLVPVLVGRLEAGDAAALAALVEPFLASDAETLVAVSSDLVHYGRRFDYLPVEPRDAATVAAAVRRLDEGALACIEANDAGGFARHVDTTGATICGRAPLEVLLRALPAGAWGERLAYTTSLDLTGDFEHTVSYAAVAFHAAAA